MKKPKKTIQAQTDASKLKGNSCVDVLPEATGKSRCSPTSKPVRHLQRFRLCFCVMWGNTVNILVDKQFSESFEMFTLGAESSLTFQLGT